MKKRFLQLWLPIGSFGLVFVLWLLYPGWVEGDVHERGQKGDAFGGLTSLFTGLAFAGLICTILLQSRELSLQREELRLTREQLQRSAKAQEGTEKALQHQVQVAALSASLAVIPNLIREEESHLRERHQMQQVESMTVLTLEGNLKNWKRRLASGYKPAPHESCMIRNLQDLIALRHELRAIREELQMLRQ